MSTDTATSRKNPRAEVPRGLRACAGQTVQCRGACSRLSRARWLACLLADCCVSWHILGAPEAQVRHRIGAAQAAAIGIAHKGRIIDALLGRDPRRPCTAEQVTVNVAFATRFAGHERGLEI